MGIRNSTYVKKSWKLNERHYGALQSMKKDEGKRIFGKERV
jgi:bisphosphoglycerate-dependent phosphoglycerate mutase